jgi:hypothetical protein
VDDAARLCGDYYPVRFIDLCRRLLQPNRERTWLYAQEIASITKKMAAHDLHVLVRKGGYLAYSIYPKAALREFNDLDLLVHESDLEQASAILREMGYAQGALTTDARVVKPLARRAKVFWRLNASPLPCLSARRPMITSTITASISVSGCLSRLLGKASPWRTGSPELERFMRVAYRSTWRLASIS